MSLFKAKEWWSVKVGIDEEFDGNNMSIGNLDNEVQADDDKKIVNKIVVASFTGKLRIYKPFSLDGSNGGGYKVEDLLLEQEFGKPILQTLIGRFGGETEGLLSLAVLFPREMNCKY